MNKKKIVSLCLVVALAAIAVLGGTLAYFTDETDQVKNTFTLGDVAITLDEEEVNEDGELTGERVESNDYEDAITPGHVFPKDPTIHVDDESQDAYIFLDVTLNKFNSLASVMAADADADEDIDYTLPEGTFSSTAFLNTLLNNTDILDKWVTGITYSDWKVIDTFQSDADGEKNTDGTYLTIRLAYVDGGTNPVVVSAGTDIQFMESVQMPASVTNDILENGLTDNSFNTEKESFHLNFKAYAIQAADLAAADAADAMFGE